jgi:hypothetical protein
MKEVINTLLVIGGSPMSRIVKKRRRSEGAPKPRDIDAIIEISPLAIMGMVAAAFGLLRIARALPGAGYRAAVAYTAGLIAIGRRATAARINRILGGVSHDALTRLREQDYVYVPNLILAFIRIVHMLGTPGYLCLDDTFIPHERSKKMDGVYWDFDHALNRNVLGSRIVVLVWSDGFFRIPVGFALWHKKGARPVYRSKNELARLLLRWAIHRKIAPEYVTFDNWYASKENMKLIAKDLKLEFATRLKRNTRLSWNGRRLQARTIGKRLLAGARAYRRNGTVARATQVVVGELGAMTFVVTTDDLDGQGVGVRYLLGSAARDSATRVVERYRNRWIIETLFEDAKQCLSLQSYQGRTVDGQMAHIALCFAGIVALDAMRKKTGMTFGQAVEAARRLVFARTPRGEYELVSLAPAPSGTLADLDDAKRVVAGSLEAVSHLRLPEADYDKAAA